MVLLEKIEGPGHMVEGEDLKTPTHWNLDKAADIVAISLTHWGRVMLIYVSNQTIIGSDNGLSPGRRQAII